MSGQNGKLLVEGDMDEALRRHYRRTKADAVDTTTPMPYARILDVPLSASPAESPVSLDRSASPTTSHRKVGALPTVNFLEALKIEDDGISGGDGGVGDYEMRQRVMGVRGFLRYIKSRGNTLPRLLQQLFAAGRAVHDKFFASLSFVEMGLLFSNTRAAHSYRCKLISGEIELGGMKGTRLPGQKTPESSASYREVAKRTLNRVKKPRQSSFLKQLKTKKEVGGRRSAVRAKQKTFTRQLNKKTLKGGGAQCPNRQQVVPRREVQALMRRPASTKLLDHRAERHQAV